MLGQGLGLHFISLMSQFVYLPGEKNFLLNAMHMYYKIPPEVTTINEIQEQGNHIEL